MPDFERVLDELRLDLAKTPEEKSYAEGYIAGKNYARKEMLYTILFFVGLGAIILLSSL